MNIIKIPNTRPRNGETHGLFGVKFLKHHKMCDEQWTAHDLIAQYERISYIFEKDNEVKKLQRERYEDLLAEKYERLKKAYKDKIEELKTLIEGDIQRTKNILLDFPDYLRVYFNKRSEEVLEELDYKTFIMRKSLDRCISERSRLIKEYENRLLDVSKFQEMICYYDIKEFQQERDTKRLYVDLKNSKTRIQTIEKINLTFKMIIDQMLHDSLYYLPVLEAVNADWKEQKELVQQTYNIGYPAIKHAKKTEREVMELSKLSKNEDAQRFEELSKNRQNLKAYSKKVKELVRRDSDFTGLNDRYLRDTKSMTRMRRDFEKMEPGVNKLMDCTLTTEPEDIISGANYMMTKLNNKLNEAMNGNDVWNFLIDQSVIVDFVHDMLLDDDMKLYDDKYFEELLSVQKAIQVEKDKQSFHSHLIRDLAELSRLIAFSFQHMVDILRHVGTKKIYRNIEYPEGRLKIHLFRFFKNIPMKPKFIQADVAKLLILIKSKVQFLSQFYKKKKEMGNIDFSNAVSVFQKTVVEDSTNTYRPRAESFDFE